MNLTDAALVERVARTLSTPRSTTSSFLLHAPLELLARAALLPWVPEGQRPAARAQVEALEQRYASTGSPVPPPPPRSFPDDESALAALTLALDAQHVEAADQALTWLTPRHDVRTLRRLLLPAVLDRVGLAAHAPILFSELLRVGNRYDGLAGLLRPALRALAATPGHVRPRLHDGALDEATLAARLRAVPRVRSESSSIAPTLASVSELTPSLLAGLRTLPWESARRVLLRTAAQSMLEDDPAHAPYGWSHCLTLPLAVFENLDAAPDTTAAVAVAATQVVAFRATLSAVDLQATWAPSSPAPSVTSLVTRAALHPDAHLVKYTRACLDAAALDPDARSLYLAAAEHLGRWWETHAAAPLG
jgi:hypothetical protein